MTRLWFLLGLLPFICPIVAFAANPQHGLTKPARPPRRAASSSPDELRSIAHEYYGWYYREHPVAASDQGLHTYDDRLTDYSAAALKRRDGRTAEYARRLAAMDTSRWSRDDRIDYLLFGSDVDGDRLRRRAQNREARDPQLYVEECSNAIFSLIKKEYAPRDVRARAAIARMRAMPALVDQARANLTRPAKLYVRLAIEAVDGIDPLFKNSLAEAVSGIPPALATDLDAARNTALEALHEFGAWLKTRERSATNRFAMGKAAYEEMLHKVFLLPVSADDVVMLGQVELARAKAFESWMSAPPERAAPGPGQKREPANEKEFLGSYEARTATLLKFLKDRDIVTVPDSIGSFLIRELPAAFKPTSPGGFMNPPGVFDQDPSGFYFIPTFDPKSENFFIRAAIENPLPILGHEGIPGHFLQLSIANHQTNEIRRMHGDGVLIEGWAFYTEEMLSRAGLYDDSPAGRVQVLRLLRLRGARVAVDVRLATGEWTFDQAVGYFMKEGGMDREAATGEAAGAASTPGQKVDYALGKWQIERLLGLYRDRQGHDFRLGRFHDELLRHGSLPLSIIEWLMLDDDSSLQKALGPR